MVENFYIIGESTTIGNILGEDNFGTKLKSCVSQSLKGLSPVVWGTCGGLILLANTLEQQKLGGQYQVCFTS